MYQHALFSHVVLDSVWSRNKLIQTYGVYVTWEHDAFKLVCKLHNQLFNFVNLIFKLVKSILCSRSPVFIWGVLTKTTIVNKWENLWVFPLQFAVPPNHKKTVCACCLKAGVHVKAVLTWLNTAFLPMSRSRFKQC